uniref:Protein SMG9 n=1 Tax=Ixodes ricinus TaxID=34613 RepID=A0A147BDX5_IXORI
MADPFDRGYPKKRIPREQRVHATPAYVRLKSSQYLHFQDRDPEPEPSQQQIKPVVILAKHPDRASAQAAVDGASGSGDGSSKPSLLLSKSSSRASSPAGSSGSNLPREDGSTGSSATGGAAVASGGSSFKQATPESLADRLAPPPDMAAPVKLVDDSLQWCDNALEYLVDQPDFYVVGVVGMQGSGKSTVMSILSGQYGQAGERQLFRPQSRELRELGQHCTTGVDIYVTPERMILLDTQPVLSASVMDHMIQFEKKTPGGGDFHSLENAHMMQSLQMASFLMAVCHTVVVVQDWFADPNFLRFVLSAEMLKPATSSGSHDSGLTNEDVAESFPHMVFVQNKCTRGDFSPENVDVMKETLEAIFAKSRLKCKGQISMNGSLKKEEQSFNLFLIPKRLSEQEEKRRSEGEPPGFQDGGRLDHLASSFMLQVLGMPRPHLTHTTLTEKNWFHYSARLWETVKKSTLFLEYSRLLP